MWGDISYAGIALQYLWSSIVHFLLERIQINLLGKGLLCLAPQRLQLGISVFGLIDKSNRWSGSSTTS